jgi:ABC-2 type transport system ATP-binding protein
MPVIELADLRKEYRRGQTVAIAGLDLEVPEGGVFGFLGPNGSGKTTTIRCILGLVRATGGRATMLGADVPGDLARVKGDVGSIVETPALFPSFSARRNLELLGALEGIGPATVAAMLERVGLGGREDDRVRTYSLGMRQRLGLAAALLKDPALLILDEPANGLDPAGIKEFRELIRSIGAEGRTVFVSSHLLGEVQQMCDRVAIIARGRLVAQGSVAEVLSLGHRAKLLARVPEPGTATAVLAAAGIVASAYDPVTDLLYIDLPPDAGARVTEVLARDGIYLSELRAEEVDLETVFLELTERVPGATPDPGSPDPGVSP